MAVAVTAGAAATAPAGAAATGAATGSAAGVGAASAGFGAGGRFSAARAGALSFGATEGDASFPGVVAAAIFCNADEPIGGREEDRTGIAAKKAPPKEILHAHGVRVLRDQRVHEQSARRLNYDCSNCTDLHETPNVLHERLAQAARAWPRMK